MDLVKLKSFLYAAEQLNFSEAAKRLHLTQPTISHHVKILEHELGTELFDRSGAKLRLTEAGRLLLPSARDLIKKCGDVKEMMTSLDNEVVGELNIACSTTAGKYILPLLAARFCERYPGIRVNILGCTPPHIVPRLLEGEANLGVVSSEIAGEGTESQMFFNDYITLIASADHPWAVRPSVSPDDLLGERLITREAESGTRRMMLAELAKHDIALDDLNVLMTLGNTEAIVHTVAAGYGVAFVSQLAAECCLNQGKIIEVPIPALELKRGVYMMRPKIDNPHRAQEVFWSFIHDPENEDLIRLAEIHQ
ncbi:MAG: LysR family transcriptional regulator [Anaerolineae bacterium]|jgi:DNA-binding transcriptional LysR family regulator|nr:LysR family transcriptional regulator [Anaerolineae bacterium]MBT4309889.1 LysR family transcriptional regulator [Anaerolineae bacterium]MBT4457496.1 LysR family transcriptional regulator [Anaerolineae bacterium]MBT4843639.1 LysR family transcriptional regulator [Anaerolineae bacterium]MBT6060795.1 LysR family transcriptional regulator [Anaerolineae bacterium]